MRPHGRSEEMKCPVCNRHLTEIEVGGITVDACVGGCGGIWFDWFELSKVDERHEKAGESLLDIARDESVVVDHEQRRNCPKDGMIMMRHFFSVKKQVQVDECPQCGGVWLDHGELAAVREQFQSEEARKAAAEESFSATFDPGLDEVRSNQPDSGKKPSLIGRMFRFI